MLILHVGRGKAGSTALQSALERSAGVLREAGVSWPKGAELTRWNHVALASAVRGSAEHRWALDELLDGLAAAPDGKHVVSSEFLFDVGASRLARFRALLPGEVTVVAYVRDYRSWVVSLYVQAVKKGRSLGDFDSFLDGAEGLVSARGAIANWTAAFGRERVVVRQASGAGDWDIVRDFSAIAGIPLTPGETRNVSPHWIETELVRELLNREATPGTLMTRGSGLNALRRAFRSFAARAVLPRAVYLSRSQNDRLADMFRSDADWWLEHNGLAVSVIEPSGDERPYLPEFRAVPQALRESILGTLMESEAVKANPYLAATLARVAERMAEPA